MKLYYIIIKGITVEFFMRSEHLPAIICDGAIHNDSLMVLNIWMIVRAMIFDGTERQSAMTVLTFKIQVESHLIREPKPPT